MRAEPIAIDWHTDLPVFAKESFLRAVSNKYGWLGGIDDSGKLRCILPYTIVQKAMVRMARFRVETILMDESFGIEEERSFLNSAVGYFRAIGADIVIPASTNTIFRTFPTGAMVAPYGTMIINLDQSKEILWSNVHPKHRNVIRSAVKKGIKIQSGVEYSRTAYKIIIDTFKRSKLPFMGQDAFMKMLAGLTHNIRVFIANYQGNVQGCAVLPFSNYSAYYMYGGSVSNPVTGAMNLLQWEAIQYFRDLGVKRYDFCGVRIDPEKSSKQAGLRAFKERFGPRLVQGYMWKIGINPIKSAVYSAAVRALRGGDIVDVEHRRAKIGQT